MWVMRRRPSGGGTGLSWASMVTSATVVWMYSIFLNLCIARRCTVEWLCALMQFVRLISIIASFSCCAARSHSRLLSQCLKHLHDATILITGVLNQTSCHTIMSLCSGLETLLQKTAGKYCVGDEVRDSYSLASFPGLPPLDFDLMVLPAIKNWWWEQG